MPVDEAGHEKAPVEIHFDGRWTNVVRKGRVVTDIEDTSVANGERAGD